MNRDIQSIAVVGVGLIGGSIGLAAQARGVCANIMGIGRNTDSLEKAKALGAATEVTTELNAGVGEADLIVICTPAGQVADLVRQSFAAAKPGAIITDVASTKAGIVAALEPQVAAGMRYVGSHPLAGSHLTGAAAAAADLFQDRTVIVTPTGPPARIADSAPLTQQIVDFWRALGAMTVEMTSTEHDEALAATSHLPHLVAVALATATPQEFLALAASGWRDTTRVAAGSVEIWQDILWENRVEVLRSLDKFGLVLDSFRSALESGDLGRIANLLEHGKQQRDVVGN